MNYDRTYYSHDGEIRAMRDRTSLILVFLVFGLGIGATLALLFAPSSGKTTRHDLARSVEEGLRTGRETAEPVVKRLEAEFVRLGKNVEEHLK
jgi:gas vesicle protein